MDGYFIGSVSFLNRSSSLWSMALLYVSETTSSERTEILISRTIWIFLNVIDPSRVWRSSSLAQLSYNRGDFRTRILRFLLGSIFAFQSRSICTNKQVKLPFQKAVAPTDVMSDRICIRSGSRYVVRLSAGNLLSCCKLCGKGCKGGFPGGAWMHWSVDFIKFVSWICTQFFFFEFFM